MSCSRDVRVMRVTCVTAVPSGRRDRSQSRMAVEVLFVLHGVGIILRYHYGLSFPAFTRSGVRIRRNLCIREGVLIRTRCVYALPLA